MRNDEGWLSLRSVDHTTVWAVWGVQPFSPGSYQTFCNSKSCLKNRGGYLYSVSDERQTECPSCKSKEVDSILAIAIEISKKDNKYRWQVRGEPYQEYASPPPRRQTTFRPSLHAGPPQRVLCCRFSRMSDCFLSNCESCQYLIMSYPFVSFLKL